MTNKYEELVNAFECRLRKLISEYTQLSEENVQLKHSINRKHEELMHAHQEVLVLREKIDHMKLATSISGSESDKNDMKNKIAKMVREIDKCITLLDE